jgi:Protein of unknown function (DUF1186)/SEC-C motif
MTLDEALRDLVAAESELPRAAMRWALEHWDEAGPRFLALLDAYARGQDRSEPTERALFFIVHLLGEKAETAAFGPLCRLLLDAEASGLVLGDAITTTLRGVLISTYDGDLAALRAVIEAEGADEFVREGALLALAYLARTGRVPEAEVRAYLVHLLAAMRPQAEHFVWVGWLLAVAHLGYAELAGEAEGLIRRGLVSQRDWRVADFRRDLRRTLADPARLAGFAHDRVGPFTGAIEELEGWYASSGEDAWPTLPALADYEARRPVTNPLRKVGRNDPCPCGSGKKFKGCCLVA